MISLEQLVWTAPGGDFSLQIDARLSARVTGLFGHSGSGKTTLVELIAGLRRPSAGALRIDATTLADTAARVHVAPEHRHIGYVPQDATLFPHLTVEQNLRYGMPRGRDVPVAETRFTLGHVCDLLGIGHLRAARVPGLSGGERQRVALARALLSHPRLLLLDEPLASLDESRKATILPYLQRIRDEFSLPMLYVSHAPEEMIALCDDMLVLSAGRLIQRGPPATLFEPTGAVRYRLRGGDVSVAET